MHVKEHIIFFNIFWKQRIKEKDARSNDTWFAWKSDRYNIV